MLDESDSWVPSRNHVPVRTCCGFEVSLRAVVGRLVPDHKCVASKGFVCDCACGGANHESHA